MSAAPRKAAAKEAHELVADVVRDLRASAARRRAAAARAARRAARDEAWIAAAPSAAAVKAAPAIGFRFFDAFVHLGGGEDAMATVDRAARRARLERRRAEGGAAAAEPPTWPVAGLVPKPPPSKVKQ